MEGIFNLGILIRVMDMVSGPVKQIAGNIDGLHVKAEKLEATFSKFRDYGRWMAAAGIVGAIGLGVAVTQFANLEEAQLGLKTLIMDSTGQVGPEFEKLNTLADRLGTALPGSTKDMIEMFTALREQGVQTNIILGGTGEAAAKFAVLMKIPYAQGATMVAKFTEALGIADKEAVPFMDTLQRLKGAAGVNTTDMYESLKYMGSTLKMLRVQGLEAGRDVSAAIGMMATSSIEGSQAGTNFALAMSRFADIDSRLGKRALEREIAPLLNAKGIKLNLFDAGGNFAGIRGMMAELEKLRALNPQQQMKVLSKLFGQEAERPLSVFIDKGVAGFDEMLVRMQKQADMETKIKTIMSGVKMQWETLTGTVANLVAHIGGAVAKSGMLIPIMKLLNDLAGRLDAWVVANPETAGRIATLALVVTGLTLAAGGLLLTIGIGGSLVAKAIVGIGAIGQSFGLLKIGINGVIGRIGALSAASTWGWVSNAAAGFTTWTKAVNIGTIPALVRLTRTIWGMNAAVLANPYTWIVVAIIAVIGAVVLMYKHFEWFKTLVDYVFFTIGFGIGLSIRGFRLLGDVILAAFEYLRDMVKFLWELAKKVFPAVTQALGGSFNAMSLGGNLMPKGLKELGNKAWDGLTWVSNQVFNPYQRDVAKVPAPVPAVKIPTLSPEASKYARDATAPAAPQKRTTNIHLGNVTLPGVANPQDFLRQLQMLVEAHDAN